MCLRIYVRTAALAWPVAVALAWLFAAAGVASADTVAPMAGARSFHTATLLPSGHVLVAGGFQGSGVVATAELYNPLTGTWSATGSLATGRAQHSATLLPGGKVLVVGGVNPTSPLASAELFDPVAGAWSAAGSLATARHLHTATLLPSGKVLVAGGGGGPGPPVTIHASAELYDPATNTWSPAAPMSIPRADFTATLLASGKVLAAGGFNPSEGQTTKVELYDPATNTWSAARPMVAAREAHTATLLANGEVLVTGGYFGFAELDLVHVERYDPAANTWSFGASLLVAREFHTATLLPSGKVLVAGGFNTALNSAQQEVEIHDPARNTWTQAAPLAAPREMHTATLLGSGKVLVAGGYDPRTGADLDSVELIEPPATVVEFYNAPLDNFFITANLAEQAAIAGGSAGPGWTITSGTFKPGGPLQVCRFYGSITPGPNSHFYTIDPDECQALKDAQAITPPDQKRWNFESLDFNSTAPAGGACPAGTEPVYRAYNDGFARGIDSNHRITASSAHYQAQIAKGWRGEGVVMCAPV